MRHLLVAAVVYALVTPMAWAEPRSATLNVSNMTCATCPITVKRALARVKGVVRVRVDFDRKQADVTYDDATTTVAALIRATTEAGYPSSVAPARK